MALPTLAVKDGDNAPATINTLNSGRNAAADSASMALSTEDLAAIAATTTAITDISKAEDAAHSSGDKGVMALGVRKDTAAALAGADGDYQPAIFDANGRLHAAAAMYLGATAVTAGAGAVATGTPRVTLASDDPAVSALQSIRDSTATVNVGQDVSSLYNGATALTVKRIPINKTSTGDLVSLVSGKKIRVTNVFLMCSAALTVTFTSGTGPTSITGPIPIGANGGFAPGFDPTGHFETASGEKLAMTISGTGTAAGWLNYVEV